MRFDTFVRGDQLDAHPRLAGEPADLYGPAIAGWVVPPDGSYCTRIAAADVTAADLDRIARSIAEALDDQLAGSKACAEELSWIGLDSTVTPAGEPTHRSPRPLPQRRRRRPRGDPRGWLN